MVSNVKIRKPSSLTIVAAITSTVSSISYPVEVVIEPSSANGMETPSFGWTRFGRLTDGD